MYVITLIYVCHVRLITCIAYFGFSTLVATCSIRVTKQARPSLTARPEHNRWVFVRLHQKPEHWVSVFNARRKRVLMQVLMSVRWICGDSWVLRLISQPNELKINLNLPQFHEKRWISQKFSRFASLVEWKLSVQPSVGDMWCACWFEIHTARRWTLTFHTAERRRAMHVFEVRCVRVRKLAGLVTLIFIVCVYTY